MSREFGSYMNGYFHSQIEYAADDLAGGSLEITKMWAPFFREFYPIAYAICSAEACDSGVAYPITETIKQIDTLKAILKQIDNQLQPYRDVMEEAVSKAIREGEVSKAAIQKEKE